MRVRTLATLLGLWLIAAPAAAQEQRASIEGTVKDNTGAVLPGVTVDAKNLSQGGVASAVSDAAGFFRFPSLAPGAYEVTAKLSGFTPRTTSTPSRRTSSGCAARQPRAWCFSTSPSAAPLSSARSMRRPSVA